jgi:methylenetetrahydrofolate reductase (NADPH)
MMKTHDDNARKLLVVGSEPDFIETSRKVFDESYTLTYALNEKEAIERAREAIPDAILLGYLEPRGTSFRLHQKFRKDIATKSIPLLVAGATSGRHSEKGWSLDEGLYMDADDYFCVTEDGIAAVSRVLELDPAKTTLPDETSVKTFREAVTDPDTFCVTWEQIAGKGAFETQQEKLVNNVIRATRGGNIHGISVTDNPGGNPAFSTEMLCSEIKKMGIDSLVHLACRDRNRNQMESVLYGLSAAGVKNVLLVSGDAPSDGGFNGKSKPVFDLDPIHTLQLIELMNDGLEVGTGRQKKTLIPTDFFAGVAVSPFKKTEAELYGQYYKLEKKIRAGAKFVINQVGYDARKWHEVLQWLEVKGHKVPAIANIYVISRSTAKMMNRNQIPGCVVTEKMLGELEEEEKSADKGKASKILRAAKMYAVAKGMGYAGAHIGGHNITFEDVEYIINKGNELSANWRDYLPEFDYPQEDGFYFFGKDPETGLNTDRPVGKSRAKTPPLTYRLSRLVHAAFFHPDTRTFRVLQRITRFVDSGRRRRKIFGYLEHMAKSALYDCMNCGDCALPDAAYVCPMSQCPKSQRNGPCGGSYDGWCEVYPGERKCIWVRAYERKKAYGEEEELSANIVPPCNWSLWETPSWLNLYMGRDHTAKRMGISPPETES